MTNDRAWRLDGSLVYRLRRTPSGDLVNDVTIKVTECPPFDQSRPHRQEREEALAKEIWLSLLAKDEPPQPVVSPPAEAVDSDRCLMDESRTRDSVQCAWSSSQGRCLAVNCPGYKKR